MQHVSQNVDQIWMYEDEFSFVVFNSGFKIEMKVNISSAKPYRIGQC